VHLIVVLVLELAAPAVAAGGLGPNSGGMLAQLATASWQLLLDVGSYADQRFLGIWVEAACFAMKGALQQLRDPITARSR